MTLLRSFVVVMAALFSFPAHAPAQPVTSAPIDVSFTTVDESGKPIPGVIAYVMNSYLPLPPYGPSRDHGLTFHSGDDGVIHFGALAADRGLLTAVAAAGYGSKTVSISPGHNPPNATLQRRDPAHQDKAIIGRLVNSAGKPVAGAFLLVSRVQETKNSWSWGSQDGDAAAMTDDQGRFALVTDAKSIGTWLEVHHKDYPPYQFRSLLPGADEQTLTIAEPVVIRGRLKQGAGPAPNIELAICRSDRDQYATTIARARTDDQGRFTFPLISPDQKWLLFAPMDVSRSTTIAPREIEATPAGQSIDLGDLDLVPTILLGGRIKTDDASGQTSPQSTVILQHFRTAEILEAQGAADGSFEFKNIPRGSYNIYVATKDPNWHISPKNRAYPYDNAFFIQGMLDGDKPDLTILLTQDKAPAVQRRAETLPMRGIEPHDDK